MAHLFICPSCGNRSAATERTAGHAHEETWLRVPVRAARRRLPGKPVQVHAEGDRSASVTADLFAGYDDDGGLRLVLTPAK